MAQFYRVMINHSPTKYDYKDSLYDEIVYGKNVYDVFNRVVYPIVQSGYYDMNLDDPNVWTGFTQQLDLSFNKSNGAQFNVEIFPNDRIRVVVGSDRQIYKRTSDNTLVPVSSMLPLVSL